MENGGEPDNDALRTVGKLLEGGFQEQALREAAPGLGGTSALLDGVESLGARGVTPRADVRVLRNDADWARFQQEFVGDRTGNLVPWFRCISLLRGLGAQTVLVEPYYVCLDHKSEFVTFYAHIDEVRDPTTVRLHFFGADLTDSDLSSLDDPEIESYKGYIVCRRGALPLVGRALLQPPSDYISESTEIEEPVHLFGQTLRARGVPFMQQDQRFAVCAHVAVWIIEYTAYRRGLTDRRVIANVAESTGATRALLPRTSQGLSPNEVARALEDIGFRTAQFMSPTPEVNSSSLPLLSKDGLPHKLQDELRRTFGDLRERPNTVIETAIARAEAARSEQWVLDMIRPHLTDKAFRDIDSPRDGETPDDLAAQAFAGLDAILDHLLAPYVWSRLPVYLATRDHAMVLCGRTEADGGVRYFFHDDQLGPYLVTEHLHQISIELLEVQAGWRSLDKARSVQEVPPMDQVQQLLKLPRDAWIAGDADRSVEMVVLSVPARAMLFPWDAIADALVQVEPFVEEFTDHDTTLSVRASIMMGIDYKSFRRQQALVLGDESGRAFFAALNVAEWVVVVEGILYGNPNRVRWEMVYDASASGATPRLQVARYLQVALAENPGHDEGLEGTLLGGWDYEPVVVPMRVGKVTLS